MANFVLIYQVELIKSWSPDKLMEIHSTMESLLDVTTSQSDVSCKVVTVEADNSQQVSQSTVKIEPSQLEKLESVNNVKPSQINSQFSIKLEASQIGKLESVNTV